MIKQTRVFEVLTDRDGLTARVDDTGDQACLTLYKDGQPVLVIGDRQDWFELVAGIVAVNEQIDMQPNLWVKGSMDAK